MSSASRSCYRVRARLRSGRARRSPVTDPDSSPSQKMRPAESRSRARRCAFHPAGRQHVSRLAAPVRSASPTSAPPRVKPKKGPKSRGRQHARHEQARDAALKMLVEHGQAVVDLQPRQQIAAREQWSRADVGLVAGCENDAIDLESRGPPPPSSVTANPPGRIAAGVTRVLGQSGFRLAARALPATAPA